eukprot:8269328-Heterocapsa_arctica.AAC.1
MASADKKKRRLMTAPAASAEKQNDEPAVLARTARAERRAARAATRATARTTRPSTRATSTRTATNATSSTTTPTVTRPSARSAPIDGEMSSRSGVSKQSRNVILAKDIARTSYEKEKYYMAFNGDLLLYAEEKSP